MQQITGSFVSATFGIWSGSYFLEGHLEHFNDLHFIFISILKRWPSISIFLLVKWWQLSGTKSGEWCKHGGGTPSLLMGIPWMKRARYWCILAVKYIILRDSKIRSLSPNLLPQMHPNLAVEFIIDISMQNIADAVNNDEHKLIEL